MRLQTCVGLLILLAMFVVLPNVAQAQLGSGMAGISVDADGVIHKQVVADPTGELTRERRQAARAALDPDVASFNRMRKVSLNRLEAELKKSGGVPTDEMRHLAGLQRIKYVFFYPETKDIVVAGPAEGWMTNPVGRVVGIKNGRPTLQLQDLVVALRSFPPNQEKTPLIGCSIDPTPEGLASMQQFLTNVSTAITPEQTEQIVTGLQDSLGKQKVTVEGISPKTHMAHILVEADYRMKLIGIGLERPPIRLVSFVDRANPKKVARNALQRWFFVPDYQCVRTSDDGMAMEMVGDGVKLIGANEMVTSSGQRRQASSGNRASDAFVSGFTRKYSQLADVSPIFAELRNVIDMTVAAAYIQDQDFYAKAGWNMGILGDESKFAVETYQATKLVDTAVAAKWKGNQLMTPVGGGVRIEPTMALDSQNLLEDENGKVDQVRQQVKLELDTKNWWWD
jgi:uncharacterized protein DUF1598